MTRSDEDIRQSVFEKTGLSFVEDFYLVNDIKDWGGFYLFGSESGVVEYVVIETELREINEYIVLSNIELLKKMERIKGEIELYTRIAHSDNEDAEFAAETAYYLENFISLEWEHTYSVLAGASHIMIVVAFLEKSLKNLANSYSKTKSPLHADAQRSKIDKYLDYISQDCGINFVIPDEFIEMKKWMAKIRNNFAHGDWDQLAPLIEQHKLSEMFAAIKTLFEEMESAQFGDTE